MMQKQWKRVISFSSLLFLFAYWQVAATVASSFDTPSLSFLNSVDEFRETCLSTLVLNITKYSADRNVILPIILKEFGELTAAHRKPVKEGGDANFTPAPACWTELNAIFARAFTPYFGEEFSKKQHLIFNYVLLFTVDTLSPLFLRWNFHQKDPKVQIECSVLTPLWCFLFKSEFEKNQTMIMISYATYEDYVAAVCLPSTFSHESKALVGEILSSFAQSIDENPKLFRMLASYRVFCIYLSLSIGIKINQLEVVCLSNWSWKSLLDGYYEKFPLYGNKVVSVEYYRFRGIEDRFSKKWISLLHFFYSCNFFQIDRYFMQSKLSVLGKSDIDQVFSSLVSNKPLEFVFLQEFSK